MNEVKKRWEQTPKWIKVTGMVILGIGGAVLFGFLFGYLIQVLWNWLMPGIFALREITYWEAVGLFILARFIFGCSFGNNDSKDKKSEKKKKVSGEKCKEEFKNWMHYDEWWEKEGKKAFENFAEKKGEGNKEE